MAGLGLSSAALADGFKLPGDGSGTSNPELLGVPCNCARTAAPREGVDPFYDVNWAVGLRGTYSHSNTSGAYFETQLKPEFSAQHLGAGHSYGATGDAEFDRSAGGAMRIGALRLGVTADNQFNAWSSGSFISTLALTQASPVNSSLPVNTAIAPQVFAGDAKASLTRQFGHFNASVRGNVSRGSSGPTTLTDMSLVDNSADNNWTFGGGLRLGYALTPILTSFVDGDVSYKKFDIPSPSLLVYLDGRSYKATTGISAKWNTILKAEASVGVGYFDYTDGTLPDAVSGLYNASVTYNPDPTLSLTGSFSTSLGPSTSSPLTTKLAYVAEGNVSYLVNPQLTLRGSAGWNHAVLLGSADTIDGYEFGVGADFQTSEHMKVTADYDFNHSVTTPSPAVDTHTVAVGLKFVR